MKENQLILILGLAGFVVMADNFVISPILPAIAKSIQVNPVRAGLLITAYMIPFGLFQLLFGPLADRFGKKQVITGSMIFFTIGTALCGLGSGLFDLGFYRGITGVFAASVMPISFALIGDMVPMERRQQAIGTFLGISFLGQGFSMAIGGSIAYFLTWREVFYLYAALSLLPTLLLLFVGRRAPSQRNSHSQFLKPYASLLGSSKSLFIYLVLMAEGILVIGSFSYLGAFAEALFQYDYLTIGLNLTAFGLGTVITGRLVGKIVPKIGRTNTLCLGLFLAGAADILLFGWSRHPMILIMGIGLLGIGFMLAHSSLITMATEFAKAARGTAMSLVAFCFMGGGGVGTAIGGKIIASAGYHNFYGLYGLFLLVLIIAARGFVREGEEAFLPNAVKIPALQPERRKWNGD